MDLNSLKTLDSADLSGQRVLVRVDINVPIKDGIVTDDTRIRAIVPTVRDILAAGGQPILVAHLGRPKGKPAADLSLEPLVAPLKAAIGADVTFCAGDIASDALEAANAMAAGHVLLIENVRFHPGEEANEEDFARQLAALAGVYVNDAFSAAHRAHASTEGVARFLPAFAGRQMQAELEALKTALEQPVRPTAALVGGAKVSTKIPVLTNLIDKVDKLIVGGGMANTFLLAQGVSIGKSLAEPDLVQTAREILAKAAERGCAVLLPTDAVVAQEFKEAAPSRVVAINAVGDEDMVLDIGPETVAALTREIADCKTLVWNGPCRRF